MENFFKKVFKNSNEIVENTETKEKSERHLDPEKKEYIDNLVKYTSCDSCDGNFALERQMWIENNNLNINLEGYIYSNLCLADPEQYFLVKGVLDSFYQNNNFDINLVRGSFKKPIRDSVLGLKNIGWETIQNKQKFLQDIKDQKLNSFDEKRIRKLIGDKEFERIVEQTRETKENLELRAKERNERLLRFKESGKDKDPLMASNINFSILDIHGENSNSDNPLVLELQKKLPENLSKLIINVKQIEGTNSKDEYNHENYNEKGFFNIADTNGYLPPKAIESIIEKDKKSAVVMYGGHLKLCFASAFNQIKSASQNNSPEAVDIHVPLDMCYDEANFQTDKYKLPIIPNDNSQFELYKDQEILSVGEGVKDENPRSRIYLWSNSLQMLDAINTQNRLDTVRNQINIIEE